jgi:hypothetical protein
MYHVQRMHAIIDQIQTTKMRKGVDKKKMNRREQVQKIKESKES